MACFSEDLEELEILPASTKPRASHHRSPGGERSVETGGARRASLKGREGDIVSRTLELFQRRHWGHFWETGWSAYGLFWAHIYHLELNWTSRRFQAVRSATDVPARCMLISPKCVKLTAWCSARGSDSDSSSEMNLTCVSWLQLTYISRPLWTCAVAAFEGFSSESDQS